MSQRQELPTMLFSLSHLLCLDVCLPLSEVFSSSTCDNPEQHAPTFIHRDHLLPSHAPIEEFVPILFHIFPFFFLKTIPSSSNPTPPPFPITISLFFEPSYRFGNFFFFLFISNRHPIYACKPPFLFSQLIEFAADF